MAKRVHCHPNLIFAVGTQVVTLRDVVGQNGRTLHPRGAVGVVVKSPTDLDHAYRIRFPDGVEEALISVDLTTLAKFKEGVIGDTSLTAQGSELFGFALGNYGVRLYQYTAMIEARWRKLMGRSDNGVGERL